MKAKPTTVTYLTRTLPRVLKARLQTLATKRNQTLQTIVNEALEIGATILERERK